MTNNSDDDLSSLTLSTPKRAPVTVPSSMKSEQVIVRSKPCFEQKNLKKNFGAEGNSPEDLVAHWPNHDVWPFKYGIALLGLGCSASGMFVNATLRKALFMEHYGRLTSYGGVVVFPGLICSLTHGMMISTQILRSDSGNSGCPVCLQVRSAIIQLIFGVGYPILTSAIINFNTASQIKGLYLPKINKNPKELLGYTKQVFKPIMGKMGVIAAGQIILGMGITYLEQECFYEKILPIVEGRETFKSPEPPSSKILQY